MGTKRRAAVVAAVLTSSALAGGCAAASSRPPPGPLPPVSGILTSSQVSALRGYGSGDTAFGMNVLSALCRAKPGSNVVLSPVSLATGLGMAYLGARGRTATAMCEQRIAPGRA